MVLAVKGVPYLTASSRSSTLPLIAKASPRVSLGLTMPVLIHFSRSSFLFVSGVTRKIGLSSALSLLITWFVAFRTLRAGAAGKKYVGVTRACLHVVIDNGPELNLTHLRVECPAIAPVHIPFQSMFRWYIPRVSPLIGSNLLSSSHCLICSSHDSFGCSHRPLRRFSRFFRRRFRLTRRCLGIFCCGYYFLCCRDCRFHLCRLLRAPYRVRGRLCTTRCYERIREWVEGNI